MNEFLIVLIYWVCYLIVDIIAVGVAIITAFFLYLLLLAIGAICDFCKRIKIKKKLKTLESKGGE